MRFVAIALVLVAFAGCESVEEQVASPKRDCVRPEGVTDISFSSTKYPNIRRHFRRAVRDGWPRVLVLRRPGADERRDDLLDAYPTRDGYDRDEYPPAVGRRRTAAHVAYVPSSENRSHGATMGIKLRRFCDGTRFRYVFY
jgi:Deoxyribonuclease NucA/NucB